MPPGRTIEERLNYLGLDADARALLAELEPILEEHAEAHAEQYYRHLLAFDETRRLFPDAETKERFLAGRRRYLVSIANCDFGADYLEERSVSGAEQERAGLGIEWITRLASLHIGLIAPVLSSRYGGEPVKASRMITALAARFALDVEISLEAYAERREASLAFMAKELANERRQLQHDLQEQGVTLRETTERAKAAEELASIATLVAGLAHEIGTPMSVIQGHAKMLERHIIDDEDGTWRLKTIQDQIARISRIIHTLLKIAHPRRWHFERVELAPLLEQTLSFVSERLARNGIHLKQRLDPKADVTGDLERLQQLFLNLFLNAADAMSEGGELSVDLSLEGDEVSVRVADTGVGIQAADLPRVFEPFFTTKEAGQGNGLGLMVCKGIAADHGGGIEVTSEPGKGTIFKVTLRREVAESAPESA